jgi:hypothetical protein
MVQTTPPLGVAGGGGEVGAGHGHACGNLSRWAVLGYIEFFFALWESLDVDGRHDDVDDS